MIKVAQGCLGQDELDQVKEAFSYNYFGHAYKVDEFEAEISKVICFDKNSVVACNTGTSALHLALDAAGIKAGDEVIVPSMTFVATCQAISALGAVPVFCDVNSANLLMDMQDLEKKLTCKTKAVIPVHYCGNICDMEKLLQIAHAHNLRIIEDAAHCFGGLYQSKPVGSFGDIVCFSFDSIKVISCGEGGAVVSADSDLIHKIRVKRLLGMDRSFHPLTKTGEEIDYDVQMQGYRYHMSNINAAIGLAQVQKLNQFINRRRDICGIYTNELKSTPQIEFLDIDYNNIVPFMFIIKVKSGRRSELKKYLLSCNIETAIKYPPSHMLSFYKNDGLLPITDQVYEEILELPLHCHLSDEDVYYIAKCVNQFMNKLN